MQGKRKNQERDTPCPSWSFAASAWHTLLGPTGLVRHIWRPWWAYRRRDFHPHQQASNLSAQWLEHNRHRFTPVGETG